MRQEQLNAIRKRAEMATKGPWEVEESDDGSYCVCSDEFRYGEMFSLVLNDDAEFIAHSRQDVPDLLAEVERLSHIVKTYQECGHLFYADQHNGHSFTDMVETKLREEASAND